MKFQLKPAAATLSALLLFAAPAAQGAGISDDIVRIGVITDMSSALSDLSGQGSVTAVEMAVEDFGGKVLGKPIEVLSADHHSKPDISSSTARKWFDVDKVDMITDLTNSAAALAAVDIAKEKDKIAIINGAGTTRLTNAACTPNSIHYTWDTYAMAHGTARAIVKNGGDTWYFLTADYAFGKQIEEDVTKVVEANGGKVIGSARHPFNANDLSSFILSAKASGAKIIGLANGGADTINSIKAAREFGVDPAKQHLAGLAVFITDIHGVGLEQAQGLLLTAAFYWDMNDETRKWSERFYQRMKKMPTAIQAGNYSSTMHYLKAIAAAGTDQTEAVMAKMREMPVNDFFAKNGKIRADGRMVHDMYLMQVKSPEESAKDWDYYKLIATIPGDEAFQPLSESTCPLVKH
ncbi:ABC transporter substrate-binding protein [Allopusillimonas soli]|uniref:ABC transporter substrate-binding protein n=1 Tax=Allopusillimonas soli TaxID=659016 RepID=A0A853F833_9BURK|nr:ABC transporter substrate-binding protein [Allopusillimonas soli]NYT35978.1 ABC transporter substrate-binding protein [Allopusillimonas soli]TEA76323.1 ABC transporter substrate-binding protein [Allopusillimonas soli]